jgi:HD-like signal output (HDOD) protein
MDCPVADTPLMMVRPRPDLAAWAAHFLATPIPVLTATAEAVEAMRLREDDVDANLIGEMVAGDPLMTLRVLSYAATNRPARMVTDTGTVTAAVVMMGIGPFFRAFSALPTVEDRLQGLPGAVQGMQDVLRRSHRAATFALAFAVHRMDPDTPLIHQAALLHDFAELLLWCHAPSLALELRQLQHCDARMRSATAQRIVLGIELAGLQLRVDERMASARSACEDG